MSTESPYAALHEHYNQIADLDHIAAVLGWDEAVMMAESSGESRARAMARLSVMRHELATSPRIGEWLEAVVDAELDSWRRANVREIRREYRRAVCLPSDLVAAQSHANSRAEQAWRKLRAENDFHTFSPLLGDVVKLEREAADHLASALGLSRYDALLDAFDPGLRSASIDPIFTELQGFLPGFCDQVIERQKQSTIVHPQGPFPTAQQRSLSLRLMKAIGFDLTQGRLDVSHHPFCGGVPDDVRITTRYDENDFTSALMGALHEAGHGMYEQGLPEEWRGQPVGVARGMAVHESQSLLQEMCVSRSAEFLTFASPLIAEEFGASDNSAAFEPENLFAVYTAVQRSFIRVDADEVTYPCHVILRYEIERDLIAGKLEVPDLPDVWDAKMRELLSLPTGDNHKDGCMQDVHWPSGAFGYFPVYTLGAMAASQFFRAACAAHPEIPENMKRGDFSALRDWLRTNVWSQASLKSTEELIVGATGKPLETAPFIAHLTERYLPAFSG
ncbi:MAG: carboxypeptidase M32 [Polyangiaceae bacterium]|nr:carboxypeptidase M32 [Polyangiaceae bacterium]